MPESVKKKRTRTSKSRVRDTNASGAHPEPPTPAAEAASVDQAEVPMEPVWEEPAHEQEPVASTEVEPTPAAERTAGTYHESGLEGLLRDDEFINQIVQAMNQSKAMDSLAEDVAETLQDALGSNPEFQQRLVNAVVSTETFRRKLVRTIARNSE